MMHVDDDVCGWMRARAGADAGGDVDIAGDVKTDTGYGVDDDAAVG